MKKLYLIFIALCLAACHPEETIFSPQAEQPDLLPVAKIDYLIQETLAQEGAFAWSQVAEEVLWSALVQSDSVLLVGYQPAGEQLVNQKLHTITVADPAWVQAKERVLDQILAIENGSRETSQSAETLLLKEDDTLPYMEIRTASLAVVQYLRASPRVRYVEPASYYLQTPDPAPNQRVASKLSCTYIDDAPVPAADYQSLSPEVKASWNLFPLSIPQAWGRSTGAGITVGLIDTGTSPTQPKLGSEFNQGESQGRTITKLGTYQGDASDDLCGHGTRMAGLIVAPRGYGGTAVGVAYNANLVAIRGTGDVILDSRDEKRGVANALKILGNSPDVRIISMSIGSLFSIGSVKDAIRYAYGKGKLIFCAAGTSTSFTTWAGVIFPARMSETVAVTGVREGNQYKRCNTCHTGSAVDFTMTMQRSDPDRTTLALPEAGTGLSTVGGSSAATAIAAGVAALVWSTDPSMHRDAVYQRLKETADLYPNRDRSFGWGNIDAYQAVAGSGAVAKTLN